MRSFEEHLKAKREYYGNTEAAIEFAADEYANQTLFQFLMKLTTGRDTERWEFVEAYRTKESWNKFLALQIKEVKKIQHPMMVGISHPCEICGQAVQTVQFEKDKEIIKAVREMRQRQREFFKDTRNMDVLSRAKTAEKRVDALIADMDSPQEKLL